MARYRVRWRTILFNLPIIVAMVAQLQLSWPTVRASVKSCLTDNPDVAQFISTADAVYQMLVTRR